ncbi:MAG: hypothetical protein WCO25_06445, partial [Candidatus Uhrbacteria bacterium]
MKRSSVAEILSFPGECPAFVFEPFVRAAAALEPYEEFAPSTTNVVDRDDHFALISLMQSAGVFDGAFQSALWATVIRMRKHLDASGGHLKAGRLRDYDRMAERFHRLVTRAYNALRESGRPLAVLFLREVLLAAHIFSFAEQIKRVGFAEAKKMSLANDKDGMTPLLRRSVNWYSVAGASSPLKPLELLVRSGSEAFGLLRESVFEPTVPAGVRSKRLVMTDKSGNHYYARFRAYERMNPMSLVSFDLVNANGQTVIEGDISRVNGSVLGAGMRLLPIVIPYLLHGKASTYDVLRLKILLALEQCVLDGSLRERSFIEEEDDDFIGGAEASEQERIAVDDAGLEASAIVSSPEEPVSEFVPISDLTESPRRSALLFRRLSWQRIMRGFVRFGVDVTFGGSHPKLFHNGITTRFLNPHETDTHRNRH